LFSEIIIVSHLPDEFKAYPDCRLVSDHYAGIGPLGGIHAALNATSCDAVFVFAGDMPLLNGRLIRQQIDYFDKQSCEILVPKIGKSIEPLHSIYKKSVLTRLDEYISGKNDIAVRAFFKTAETLYMELDETEFVRNVFSNINRPSDLRALERLFFS
jgi:molybdopterin-guanine dinucleotide biosynthesis protein A